MSKKKVFQLGVIGLGVMGKHHARVAAHTRGLSLGAVADLDEKTAQEVGEKHGVPWFTNYHELFPFVDAVIVASPTASHFEVGKDCLSAGKPALIEKPLAKTSEQAQRLVVLAKEKNLPLAVGLIERFNPAFVELAKLIKKEKILGLDIKRRSPFPERITDANVIIDMMIHDLDLMLTLMGNDEIESLKVIGEKVKTTMLDKVNATVYFRTGTIAKIDADRVFGSKTRKIVVTTDKALYEADLLSKNVYVRTLEHISPSSHFTKQYDQLTAEIMDFVLAIKRGQSPKVSATAGLKCLQLAEEVEKACS